MAMLKSRMLRGLGSRIFRSVTSTVSNRNSYWNSPQATVMPSFHRPMSTSEVNKRTSMEDLRSLTLVTAPKTPYLPNGQFDLDAYDNLVNMHIAKGVEGILVAGTTGEGYLMTWDEQIMLIAHTVNTFGDKVKIIGNAGSNCTSEAITATEQGFAVGMDAALHINPYYGKTSSAGLLAHYNSVLSIGPVILYNVPTRTSHDIPPSVVEALAQNPNFVGIKECVGNDRIKKYVGEGLAVWTGNDEESHDAKWECGATGLHSVAGNIVPGLMHQLMFGGKNPELNSKLMPLFDWLFHVPVPIALNTALAQLGVIRPVFRLPHVPVPVEKRREFVNLVNQIGREHFVGEKDVQVLDDDDFIMVPRNTYWKPPQAAVRLDIHLPMSSSAVKDRASIEATRSLRFITAVKTPYLPSGQFDLEAYDNLVSMQIANGAEGILVAGSTGEGSLMTWDEQIMLIAHTVNCFGDKVKIIGNAGSNCTSEAIKATERGFAVGMDAALHINPYYGKTSLDGLVAHYNSVLSIGPIIIYNVPARTAQDIPPNVIEILAQNPNFIGIKECVGKDRIKQYTDKGIVVWTGIDRISHDARWDCGAVGVHSVAGNLIPGLMRELMFGGKNPTLNSKLTPLFDWLSQEPGPIALNTALAQLGVIKPVFRLPHVPLPMEKRVEFVNLVKEMGREHFVGEKDVQVLDDDDFITVGRY